MSQSVSGPIAFASSRRAAVASLAWLACLASAGCTHDRSVQVPVLMYHHIQDLGPEADQVMRTWTVSTESFEQQLSWLEAHGYHTISLNDLAIELSHDAAPPLPHKPVVITFDDGWDVGYSLAFPALRRHHMIGTFFVYPGAIGDNPASGYMTWTQLQEMTSAGMDIESHTISHPHLRSLDAAAQQREIADSRTMLESRLHRSITAFAYPFGEFNPAIESLVAGAGYRCAVGIEPGYTQRSSELFALHRMRVSYGDTIDTFKELVTVP
jgi:peptidoglycan/xylan/chitin deacetylase (PgdA/CDA1 family)